MSDIPPFCVYVHGCPGFHNYEICKKLSALISCSQVLRPGIDAAHHLQKAIHDQERAQLNARGIVADPARDHDWAKQHSWVFADFRGTAGIDYVLPLEEYEKAADSLNQPFVHVVLRCKSKRPDHPSRLGRSVPSTGAIDFRVFESMWEKDARTSKRPNKLEVEIDKLEPADVAKEIFKGISEMLHF
ncbi:hypothetical protein ACQKWADRAFT_71895 [Trichoderma austrokoningii]